MPAKVMVRRPIPRRDVPLKGIKRMLFPSQPMEIDLVGQSKSPWDRSHFRQAALILLLVVSSSIIVFLYLAVILNFLFS